MMIETSIQISPLFSKVFCTDLLQREVLLREDAPTTSLEWAEGLRYSIFLAPTAPNMQVASMLEGNQ